MRGKAFITVFSCSSKLNYVFSPLLNPFLKERCSADISRVRIQLLSCHDLIFLRGTSCFLTSLPLYRPKSVGQSQHLLSLDNLRAVDGCPLYNERLLPSGLIGQKRLPTMTIIHVMAVLALTEELVIDLDYFLLLFETFECFFFVAVGKTSQPVHMLVVLLMSDYL